MTLSIDQRIVRVAAREAVAAEIQSGRMNREPCERCGAEKAQAHHDDYSKPLEVRWLCQTHHHEVHREIGTPMGRKPRAGTAGRPVTFRAAPAEILQWAIAAEREKCGTLSAWIVKTLNQRAAMMRARGGL